MLAGQPVLILKEGSERTTGKDALRNNIMAAIAVAEAVQSTLGPRGLDKLLVDNMGDIVITNDGATILDEIDVEHPAAKMLVQVAKAQDQEVGDGTTTSVILAGELLRRAEKLLDQKIHPTLIVSGYKKATEKAIEYLRETSIPVKLEDEEFLIRVARTSLNSKTVGNARDHFARIAVEAVKRVFENGKADLDDISIIKKQGKSLEETELVKGVVIDKEVLHPRMPKEVRDARIALINFPLEVKKTEFDAKIRINDPNQLGAFIEAEHQMLREMVTTLKEAGAKAVFCQKGVDDLAQHFLAMNGIMAVRRVKKSDMERLARATNARIITNWRDFSPEYLGTADVREEKIGDEKIVYVENCPSPKAVSIVIRGANKYVTEEAERALHDALSVVKDVVEDGFAVPGGGAPEVHVSRRLRKYAEEIAGREQFAVEAYAEALEAIPKTLAHNSGMDPIRAVADLIAAQTKDDAHAMGIEVFSGQIKDMIKEGVVEPLRVKQQVFKSASEAAEMILRIDDVIVAKDLDKDKKEGEGSEYKPPSPSGF